MSDPVRVLVLDDSDDDARLMMRELEAGGLAPAYERVETERAMAAALAAKPWDLILADFSMPQFDGLSALIVLKHSELDIPFILVSGAINEHQAAIALKAGARDCIMKDNLRRLVPVVNRELRAAGDRREVRRLEAAEQAWLAREAPFARPNEREADAQRAAGLARGMDTPLQLIGDSSRSAQEAFKRLAPALALACAMLQGPAEDLPSHLEAGRRLAGELDPEALSGEILASLGRIREGVESASQVVATLKEIL